MARHFGIDERNVRRWRKEKIVIKNMPKFKRNRRRGAPWWPELEDTFNSSNSLNQINSKRTISTWLSCY